MSKENNSPDPGFEAIKARLESEVTEEELLRIAEGIGATIVDSTSELTPTELEAGFAQMEERRAARPIDQDKKDREAGLRRLAAAANITLTD